MVEDLDNENWKQNGSSSIQKDTEQNHERESNRDEESRVRRRAILLLLGVGGIGGSIAGFTFLPDQQSTSGNQVASNQSPSNATEATSPVNELAEAHNTYRSQTPEITHIASFDYQRLSTSTMTDNGEQVSVTAEPSQNGTGDRVIIHASGRAISHQELARKLRATWGASPDTEVTTNVFGTDIIFTGGEGAEIAVLTGVGTVPDVGTSVLVTRGRNIAEAERLTRNFDSITSTDEGSGI
jgi:hypothetical protein